jgi:hypothetical protein
VVCKKQILVIRVTSVTFGWHCIDVELLVVSHKALFVYTSTVVRVLTCSYDSLENNNYNLDTGVHLYACDCLLCFSMQRRNTSTTATNTKHLMDQATAHTHESVVGITKWNVTYTCIFLVLLCALL